MNATSTKQGQRTTPEIGGGIGRSLKASFPRSLKIVEATAEATRKNDAKSIAEKADARVSFQIRRGLEFCNDDNFAKGLACFDRAINLNVTDVFAHVFRGWTLLHLDRAEEALAAFDTALGIDPNNAETLFMHGLLLARSERFEEALVSFDSAIRLAPSDPAGYFGRGWALDALGRHFEEALDAFNTAARLDTDGALIVETLVHRAVLLKKHPREWASEQSDKDVEEACRIAPDYAGSRIAQLVEDFKRRRAASGEDEAAWNKRVWREARANDEAYARKIGALESNQAIESADNFKVENRNPNRDNARKTGKTGAKDEGLVQEPQSKIADAGIETARRSERRLSPAELSKFRAHAAANMWDSNSGVAPSAHIKRVFAKWLGRGLSRSDIVAAQPNLAQAYATETSRDPTRKVKGLVVRPHRLPPGGKPALSMRPVWQLTKKELEAKRALEREKKQRQRQRQKDATLT